MRAGRQLQRQRDERPGVPVRGRRHRERRGVTAVDGRAERTGPVPAIPAEAVGVPEPQVVRPGVRHVELVGERAADALETRGEPGAGEAGVVGRHGQAAALYRKVTRPVAIVSQPSVTRCVNGVGVNSSRPIALNVAASVNFPSPAYSIRISMGESTSKRASPERTAWRSAPSADAAAGGETIVPIRSASAATTATGFVRDGRRTWGNRRRVTFTNASGVRKCWINFATSP
jgi:hypothetical protein